MLEYVMISLIVVSILIYLITRMKGKKRTPKLLLELFTNHTKIKGDIMAITLTTTQFVEGTLQPVDAKGRPAPVDEGTVEFSSSDENVFIVEEDPANELKLKITAIGEGVAELRYSADADLGDGVVTIEGFTAVEVLAAMATSFGIQFGIPQEQPNLTTTTTTTL